MNVEKLFKMQDALDRHIEEKHGLENTNLIEKKILALLVELGELANETRCFKFWSLKGPAAKESILAEYVDGVHFILSLGIACAFKDTVTEMTDVVDKGQDPTSMFITLYRDIVLFDQDRTESRYRQVFQDYLALGNLLGFSSEDIERAYVDKNQINYDRQKQGY
ncbi:dUTP diphosphatase [Peribacillus sp. FSL H8-0477]|uniref:dUTP diphosphatase n=1 Tax=Peribacillus sp. FSL H8-0477 TaxID=2921388 RepID=UPI0030FAE7E8